MGSQAINEKFQKHLLEEANLFYGEFMNDLSKLIVRISLVRRSLGVDECCCFHFDCYVTKPCACILQQIPALIAN